MSNQDKNPFFVLGVDFGASSAAATAAFGKASKRVRRGDSLEFTVEDLTAALSVLEEAHRTGTVEALGEHFRVPANPQAYEVHAEEGLLLLPVVPQPRKTAPISDEAVGELRRGVIDQATEAILMSAERSCSAYDLDVVVGSGLSLDQAAPSMASQARSARRAALVDLATRIRNSSSDEELIKWTGVLVGQDEPVPAEPAEALLLNPSTPPESLRSLLESSQTPLEAPQEAAKSAAASESLLEILAGHPSPLVREAVALNSRTPATALVKLRKDSTASVRKGAARKRSWPLWVRIGAAVLVVVAIALGVALATGYLRVSFSRTSSPPIPQPTELNGSDAEYPRLPVSEWNRIVSDPDRYAGERLTFYAQVVGFDDRPRSAMLVDAVSSPPRRYSQQSYSGDPAWVLLSGVDRDALTEADETAIRGSVIGQTRIRLSKGNVVEAPQFKADSVEILE